MTASHPAPLVLHSAHPWPDAARLVVLIGGAILIWGLIRWVVVIFGHEASVTRTGRVLLVTGLAILVGVAVGDTVGRMGRAASWRLPPSCTAVILGVAGVRRVLRFDARKDGRG